MKHFPPALFCLSFMAFCAVSGFCLLFVFPYGLFRPAIACDTKILELNTTNNDVDIDCQFMIKNIGIFNRFFCCCQPIENRLEVS